MKKKQTSLRGENWTMILYQESEKDMQILEYIKLNFKYAYIEHDSDYETDEETGEIKKKKPHIHIIFIFENARELNSICKELNIKQKERLEKVKSIRYMFRYLLHLDQPTKTKYEKDEIKTNVKNLVNKYCKIDHEPEDIEKIFEYIYTIDRYIYFHEVLEYVLKYNLYASYRRGASIINKIIEEHNKLFIEKKKSEKFEKMMQDKEIYEYDNRKRI